MKNYWFIYIWISASILLFSCNEDDENPQVTIKKENIVLNGKQVAVWYNKQGNQPIVFFNGFAVPGNSWLDLAAEFKDQHPVFMYDRPGTGLSEDQGGERDAESIAKEFDKLIAEVGIKPPFVLVGHSMGGIYARLYANLYPAKVAGMVLVDATHEDEIEMLLQTIEPEMREYLRGQLEQVHLDSLAKLPEGDLKEEFRANYEINFNQIRGKGELENMPVAVLTSIQAADEPTRAVKSIVAGLHKQWTDEAKPGRQVLTEESGHYIQLEEPELVIESIRWVLSNLQ